MAETDGITTIVATPHCKEGFYFNDRAKVMREVEKLRARLKSEGVGIRLEPGAEVNVRTRPSAS